MEHCHFQKSLQLLLWQSLRNASVLAEAEGGYFIMRSTSPYFYFFTDTGSATMGRTMKKEVPFPTCDSTHTRPSCASTIVLTIANPNPEPDLELTLLAR